MKSDVIKQPFAVDGKAVVLKGRFLKTAKLRSEHFDPLGAPETFIEKFRASGIKADLFTFVQEIHDRVPHYDFLHVSDELAVLPVTTYDHWFNKQLYFKPRNKLRKALKNGVEVKLVPFTDELIAQIKAVYDETPIRQGKRNWHYGKDPETIKKEHATFLERSDFVGAFYQDEMIAFAKVTHTENYSIMMNFVSKVCYRDKAAANALIAKIIEVCAERHVPYLAYGTWGRKGGTQEFRVANGFERWGIPRFFVPLTLKGRIALKLKLHRPMVQHVPEKCVNIAAGLRAKWYEFKYRNHPAVQRRKPAISAGAAGQSVGTN